MNEKEEYLERLLSSKAFAELNADELNFVLNELGSEEQYNTLRGVASYLNSVSPSEIEPRGEILATLKKRFRTQHARTSFFVRVFYAPVPAYAIVLLLVAVAFLTWLLTSSDKPKTITVMVPSTADTIRLVSKADTVYINKIKYRYIKQNSEPMFTVVYPSYIDLAPDSSLSASMKDKSELDNLLVTGLN